MAIMDDFGLKPESSQTTQVLITLFDPNDSALCLASFKLASQLRNKGLNVEIYTGENPKLGKQIDVARRKAIPLVLIIGSDELSQNKVTIKNIETGKQQTVSSTQIISRIQKILK